MNTKDYIEEIKRTAPLLGSDFLDELHMAIGLSTEAGEILDTFKKTFAYGKELDKTNIVEELGDSFWYIFNMMRMLGINFEDVLEINIAKLRARYKDGYSKEEALNRDLNKERKILEGNSPAEILTSTDAEDWLIVHSNDSIEKSFDIYRNDIYEGKA